MYCDLHLHCTASDGTTPPGKLAALAQEAQVAAIALTDHDTTDGLDACARACKRRSVAFVPGVELSVDPASVRAWRRGAEETDEPEPPVRSGTMHLLGLFINGDDPTLARVTAAVREARAQRNPRIIQRLQELGVRVDYAEVQALADAQGAAIVGRPLIAQVLLQKGYVKSIQDAFRRYIGEGAPAYVRKDRLGAAEAIDAIHAAGGLAVLAHPPQLRLDPVDLADCVLRLRDLGLDGIETRHSDHSPADVRALEELAQRLELLTSGGSDFHGDRKDIRLGDQKVPLSVYEALRAACAARRA